MICTFILLFTDLLNLRLDVLLELYTMLILGNVYKPSDAQLKVIFHSHY